MNETTGWLIVGSCFVALGFIVTAVLSGLGAPPWVAFLVSAFSCNYVYSSLISTKGN